jgi:hypothetical protein
VPLDATPRLTSSGEPDVPFSINLSVDLAYLAPNGITR